MPLPVDEETRENFLVDASGEEVRFCVGVRVRHSVRGREHTYMLPELDMSAHGRSATEARDNLAGLVRKAVTRYLTTFADLLTPAELGQKQLLLAWVDVVGSGLLPDVQPFTWVLGSIERKDDGYVFRTADVPSREFVLAPDTRIMSAAPGALRLARVSAGSAGEAVGPVDLLEDPLAADPEAVLDEWERRLERDG